MTIDFDGVSSDILIEGYGVAYSPSLTRWVAVGGNTGGSGSAKTIEYSDDDGVTWIPASTSAVHALTGFNDVSWGASLGKFVAVSGSNGLWYSSDGDTWTHVSIGGSFFSRRVAFSDQTSTFVMVGEGHATNNIWSSTDAISWTGRGSPGADDVFYGVCYSIELSKWMVIDASGVPYTASTLGTWTAQTQIDVTNVEFQQPLKLKYLPTSGYIIAVGYGTKPVWWSSNGADFFNLETPMDSTDSNGIAGDIIEAGPYWLLGGRTSDSTGRMFYSLNLGEVWTQIVTDDDTAGGSFVEAIGYNFGTRTSVSLSFTGGQPIETAYMEPPANYYTGVSWVMKLYDISGNPVNFSTVNPTASDNIIRHAENKSLTFNLNTFDELSFDLYLDDDAAANIRRGFSVVKVWRYVGDVNHNKFFVSPDPVFCGVVTYTSMSGQANRMNIKCSSPLWRLQSHFHLLNHYLEANTDTGDNYTQSELMWKLIDLINSAFGSDSFTGIAQGTFHWGLPNEPQPVPYFVGKGSNTWSNIFDDLMVRPASPDIIPKYKHISDGVSTLMEFDTDEKRGHDISNSFQFRYHTSTNANCEEMTIEQQIVPGDFGNYVWLVGQGGPNSGKVASRSNASALVNTDGYGEIGIYMARVDRDEVKRFDALNPLADAESLTRKHPVPIYTVSISPVAGIYYMVDFVLGDLVGLLADRGAMQIDVSQRVYQVTLNMSRSNVESCEVLLSHDFYGKVTSFNPEL